MSKIRTDEDLHALIVAGEQAAQEIARRARAKEAAISERVKRVFAGDATAAFAESELRYTARLRCRCGAGLARADEHGAWLCSAVLRGVVPNGRDHSWPRALDIQPETSSETTRQEDGDQ